MSEGAATVSPLASAFSTFRSYASYTFAWSASARPVHGCSSEDFPPRRLDLAPPPARPSEKSSGPKPVSCVGGSKAPSPMAIPRRLIRRGGAAFALWLWMAYAADGMYLPA